MSCTDVAVGLDEGAGIPVSVEVLRNADTDEVTTETECVLIKVGMDRVNVLVVLIGRAVCITLSIGISSMLDGSDGCDAGFELKGE